MITVGGNIKGVQRNIIIIIIIECIRVLSSVFLCIRSDLLAHPHTETALDAIVLYNKYIRNLCPYFA